ncbi:hypothetical protein BpHYR1_003003 [Brachionus plicatilis]|uniref:Uncharacterized protein n=1 Tax=Brachionus plicatilis TaxID=10195 RepID=A0A3M7RJ49_BRAPC|nr:hypothetical protein BpHYR1_003003 [Brachionus plicatilis]
MGLKKIARDASIPEKININDSPTEVSKKICIQSFTNEKYNLENFTQISNGVIKVTVNYDLTHHEDYIDIVESHFINSQRCLVQLAGYYRRFNF